MEQIIDIMVRFLKIALKIEIYALYYKSSKDTYFLSVPRGTIKIYKLFESSTWNNMCRQHSIVKITMNKVNFTFYLKCEIDQMHKQIKDG